MFVFVLAIIVGYGSGVAIVPGVHAGVVPGSIVVGGVGPWGWGGLGGRWGPWGGAWGGWLGGAGLDGQWVPDNTELLYDDGSYKPGHYD